MYKVYEIMRLKFEDEYKAYGIRFGIEYKVYGTKDAKSVRAREF